MALPQTTKQSQKAGQQVHLLGVEVGVEVMPVS